MTASAPVMNKPVFATIGKTPEQRADHVLRKPLETAELEALAAAQRVEAKRAELETHQIRLENLTSKVSQLRVRLQAVESHGFAKQLAECEEIFDRLFCSPALTEKNNQITLNSATAALGWIPQAQVRQAKLAAKLKIELGLAEKELTEFSK